MRARSDGPYVELSLRTRSGFDHVVLSGSGSDDAFVVDDLRFSRSAGSRARG